MKTTIFMQWALCTSKYCLLRKPFGALFKKTDRNRTASGQKKCPKTGQPDKAFVQERLQKMPGDIFSDPGTAHLKG